MYDEIRAHVVVAHIQSRLVFFDLLTVLKFINVMQDPIQIQKEVIEEVYK